MNFILPIILIISSFTIFFGYVDPNYKGSGTPTSYTDKNAGIIYLNGEVTKYDDILNSSNKTADLTKELVDKSTISITEVDKAKLERLLPSNLDNIRLIIEISKIAENRGLVAKNISVGDMAKVTSDSIGTDNTPYGTLSLKFTVNSTYSNFLSLLQDLESNLRLLDITDISFNATENGFYDFNVSLNTYWLK